MMMQTQTETQAQTFALAMDNMNDSHTLYVKSPRGRYLLASDDQILAAARYAADSLISPNQSLNQPEVVKDFFQAKLAGLAHECAAMVFLDSQFKLIRYVEISQGTTTQASVYPREVVKMGLRLNASAVIMAHNHPSGMLVASEADKNLTAHLKKSLALIDIRVLDHIIVTGKGTLSMASMGLV